VKVGHLLSWDRKLGWVLEDTLPELLADISTETCQLWTAPEIAPRRKTQVELVAKSGLERSKNAKIRAGVPTVADGNIRCELTEAGSFILILRGRIVHRYKRPAVAKRLVKKLRDLGHWPEGYVLVTAVWRFSSGRAAVASSKSSEVHVSGATLLNGAVEVDAASGITFASASVQEFLAKDCYLFQSIEFEDGGRWPWRKSGVVNTASGRGSLRGRRLVGGATRRTTKKASTRTSTAKQTSARKSTAKRAKPGARTSKTATASKSANRRRSTPRTTARKSAVGRRTTKRVTARKPAAARRRTVKRTAARKPAARRTARRTTARKPAARRIAARATARKPADRRAVARRKG
jgi:hypothetical protein